MCGLAGLSLAHVNPVASEVLSKMVALLRHRGPDSAGELCSHNGLASLGFRRLAIRDLDRRADQPMISASGKYAIAFNGEIYNSRELASRHLLDVPLRTTGDTEVLLELLERCGEQVLGELNGMFAIALLELSSGRLRLIRDRMGKKPLYYYVARGVIGFASELRSLKPFGLRVEPEQLELFLHFGYFPSPHTLFQHTSQVCPGEIVELFRGEVMASRRYHDFASQDWESGNNGDDLQERLASAVELRTVSDVGCGAFLSGGIDSSLVCAELARQGRRVPTFTVAFGEEWYDESEQAANTAAELGLPHQVIDVPRQDLSELAVHFQDCYEQPYADTSGLATMLLCEATKQHVTVALSGDGGDEFFGGYLRYRWFQHALLAQRSPRMLRQLVGQFAMFADARRGPRIARWLQAGDAGRLYAEILRTWTDTNRSLLMTDCAVPHADASRSVEMVADYFSKLGNVSPLGKASAFDAQYYLPDDLQVKIDRASMRVALEVRSPLLDHRIASYGLRLSHLAKYGDGLKSVLKAELRRYQPHPRKPTAKQGFSVPLARWLRGPILPVIEATLTSRRGQELGWFDIGHARHLWRCLQQGADHHARAVWMSYSILSHAFPQAASAPFRELTKTTFGRAA